MGKFCKLFLVIFCCLGLCGCGGRASAKEPPRLVTQVHVAVRHQNNRFECIYTQPQKMEAILYYLRTLEDLGAAKTDPERIIGDRYKITVHFSDGSQRIYRQQANRFLSRDDRPWRAVDPQKAELLYPLIKSMPGDQAASDFRLSTVIAV